jgi:hypothetical protein
VVAVAACDKPNAKRCERSRSASSLIQRLATTRAPPNRMSCFILLTFTLAPILGTVSLPFSSSSPSLSPSLRSAHWTRFSRGVARPNTIALAGVRQPSRENGLSFGASQTQTPADRISLTSGGGVSSILFYDLGPRIPEHIHLYTSLAITVWTRRREARPSKVRQARAIRRGEAIRGGAVERICTTSTYIQVNSDTLVLAQ